MAYKLTFSNTKGYFFNYLDFSTGHCQTTRNGTYPIPIMNYKSNWGKKSFKYNAVKLWLQLPYSIARERIISFNVFKRALQAHLLCTQTNVFVNDNECNADMLKCIDDIATGKF